MNANGTRGLFISIEGISGSGKSSLAKKLLVPFLQDLGITSAYNAEPTSANAFGIAIRMAIERQTFAAAPIKNVERAIVRLLHATNAFDADEKHKEYFYRLAGIPEKLERGESLTELDRQFLFLADSFLDVRDTIVPKLESGIWVVQDRFHLSGPAYGSAKGELTAQEIYEWRPAILRDMHIIPDITFFIDVIPETAAERLYTSGKTIDLYEGLESLRRVSVQYEKAIRVVEACEGKKSVILYVNGDRPLHGVFEEVKYTLLERRLI